MDIGTAPQAPLAAFTTEQFRAEPHHAIDDADDATVLQALLTLAAKAQPPAPDLSDDHAVRLEDLLPAVRAAVEEGIRDADAGRLRPHAEVWAELQAEFGLSCP